MLTEEVMFTGLTPTAKPQRATDFTRDNWHGHLHSQNTYSYTSR